MYILKNHRLFKEEQGQVGLAAILVSVIMLVVGLSLANQASREAIVSLHESEGTRTLEGAQTGAEMGLGADFGTGTGALPGGLIHTDVAAVAEGEFLEIVLNRGVSIELRAPFHPSLTVAWGVPGINLCDHASLLVSSYRRTGGSPINTTAEFEIYGPTGAGTGCGRVDNAVLSTGGAMGLHSSRALTTSEVDTIRIKALYHNTIVRINDSGQATLVRGAATNEQDEQVRVVEVRQTRPGAPTVMDYALFAGRGAICKGSSC